MISNTFPSLVKKISAKVKLLAILLNVIGSLLIGWGVYQYSGRDLDIVIDSSFARLPSWLSNHLPDALWMYAIASFLYIWHYNHRKEQKNWLIAALFLGVGYEIAQAAQWLSGTSDALDVWAYIAGWLAAIIINHYFLKA